MVTLHWRSAGYLFAQTMVLAPNRSISRRTRFVPIPCLETSLRRPKNDSRLRSRDLYFHDGFWD